MKFLSIVVHPQPVDLAQVLDDVAEVIRRYVVMPEASVTATALWVAHTWLIEHCEFTPRLAIISPEKQCGKSTLLTVLYAMVRRAMTTSNASAPALFRTIDQYKPTIILDENDSIPHELADGLRNILNCGFSPVLGFVLRCAGDDSEPVMFSTFAPVAVASIRDLPGTVMDRSVVLRMERSPRGAKGERLRETRIAREQADLRSRLARMAQDIGPDFADLDPTVPDSLSDRAADCWRHLLAIADLAGGEWPARARDAALALSGSVREDPSVGVQLLGDLREMFRRTDSAALATVSVVSSLLAMEDDRPWAEWGKSLCPITPRQVARMLAPFRVRPRTFRAGDTTTKGYHRSDLEPVWDRYLPPDSDAPFPPDDSRSVTR